MHAGDDRHNDARAQPLFFVTAEANDNLLAAMDNDILPQVRELVAGRMTIVFDRGGWSPETFERWASEGFDVLTYRKGRYASWPEKDFSEVEDLSSEALLSERETRIGKNRFGMREVRRLCANGHQTSIVTTRRDLPMVEVASRMFARWNQENFFRYMRHEYALDHLCTYNVEAADPERMIPNPLHAECRKKIERLEGKVGRIQRRKNERKGRKVSPEERIRELEAEIGECEERLKTLPERVPVKETMEEEKIVRLEPERKIFTDLVRMVAYRAESAMFALPLLNRNEDEGRAFLQTLFRTPADLIPDGKTLTVRFQSMPRFNKALRELCEMTARYNYPGTDVRLVFEGPKLFS